MFGVKLAPTFWLKVDEGGVFFHALEGFARVVSSMEWGVTARSKQILRLRIWHCGVDRLAVYSSVHQRSDGFMKAYESCTGKHTEKAAPFLRRIFSAGVQPEISREFTERAS